MDCPTCGLLYLQLQTQKHGFTTTLTLLLFPLTTPKAQLKIHRTKVTNTSSKHRWTPHTPTCIHTETHTWLLDSPGLWSIRLEHHTEISGCTNTNPFIEISFEGNPLSHTFTHTAREKKRERDVTSPSEEPSESLSGPSMSPAQRCVYRSPL